MSASSDSEKLLKDVKDQLTCKVCLELYTDPKVLPCLHVFCRRCVDLLVTHGERREATCVTCPTCRHETDLTGMAELLPALHIHHLFDIHDALQKTTASSSSTATPCDKCRQFASTAYCRNCGQYICDECAKVHKLWGELASHVVISIEEVRESALKMIPLKTAALSCPKHRHKNLELYCETCEVLICHYCTIQQHKTHRYDLVADTYASRKHAVKASLEPLRSHVREVSEALDNIHRSVERITTQRATLEEDINRTIWQLHEELEQRKKEFLGQLHDLAQDKLRTLAAQRAEVEHTLAQMSTTMAFVDDHLRFGSPTEVLMVLTLVNTRVDALCSQHEPERLEPRERANLIFTPGKLQELCKPVKAICTAPICSSKCLMGEIPPIAVTGQSVAFTIIMKDGYGEPYTGAALHVTAELVSPTARLLCNIDKAKAQGHYVVSCVPTIPKDYEFHVQVNGAHIQGSPSPVHVVRAVQDITKPVKVVKKMKKPRGITCNSKGDLVVVEANFPRVSVHTLRGPRPKRLKKFGSLGSAPGQFNDPDGITVDGSDNILVVDSGNHRVQKFTAEGEFITTVGTKGDGPLQFNYPTNIRIHPQTGNMYICDQYNHRVQIVKEDFSFVGSFGKEGNQEGDLLYPTDLAFDSIGNVYVCDSKNNRIQVFDPDGQYVRKFGDRSYEESCGREELEASYIRISSNVGVYQPSYLHIDGDSNVYVTNASNNVVVFKTSGEFVTLFGKQGGGAGEFSSPCGLVVNKEGLLCVSDSNNCRVQVF